MVSNLGNLHIQITTKASPDQEKEYHDNSTEIAKARPHSEE